MIGKIKKMIKQFGINQVANDLGYRSTLAIQKWIQKGKVPDIAKSKVKAYLQKKEK